MARFRRGRVRVAMAAAGIVSVSLLVSVSPAADVSVTVRHVTFPTVIHSYGPQTVSGEVELTASESAGSLGGDPSAASGWHVTVSASDLRYTGSFNGVDIPMANLAIQSVSDPVSSTSDGSAVDLDGGPKVPTVSPVGSLETARTVLEAAEGYGRGTYTQRTTLGLTIPPGARPGPYSGTITTTIYPVPVSAVASTGSTSEPTPSPEPTPSSEPVASTGSTSEPSPSSEPVASASSTSEPTPSSEPVT